MARFSKLMGLSALALAVSTAPSLAGSRSAANGLHSPGTVLGDFLEDRFGRYYA